MQDPDDEAIERRRNALARIRRERADPIARVRAKVGRDLEAVLAELGPPLSRSTVHVGGPPLVLRFEVVYLAVDGLFLRFDTADVPASESQPRHTIEGLTLFADRAHLDDDRRHLVTSL